MNEAMCRFTQLPAEVTGDILRGLSQYRCDDWGGFYILSQGAQCVIANLRGGSPQGLINCAAKVIEIQREYGKDKVPFFISESEKNNVQLENNWFIVIIEEVLSEGMDHSQQSMALLNLIAEKSKDSRLYEYVNLSPRDLYQLKIADDHELSLIANYLKSNSVIEINQHEGNWITLKDGFRPNLRGYELLRKNNLSLNSNKVFIATQFKWLNDDPLRIAAIEAIKRACKRLGYDASIVEQNHTGSITDKIISQIKSARFLIAEFTYNNRGVYYEAGFARGLGIPVFHLVKKGFISGNDEGGTRMHFDIQQIMYREWDTPENLENTLFNWIDSHIGKYGKLS